MGFWALVLAIIPIPVSWIVSLVLALRTLVRSRDGHDHGDGFAIAALLILPLWVLLIACLLVASLVGEMQRSVPSATARRGVQVPGTRPGVRASQAHDIEVSQLRQGDCLPSGMPRVVTTVKVGPCSQPHRQEVYAVFDLGPGSFPGQKSVDQRGDAGCQKRFRTYVGLDYDASEMDFYAVTPEVRSLSEDRTVVCVVVDVARHTGTLREARR